MVGGIVFLGLQLRKWTAATTRQYMIDKKRKERQAALGGGGGSVGGSFLMAGVAAEGPQQKYALELNNQERRRDLDGGRVEMG